MHRSRTGKIIMCCLHERHFSMRRTSPGLVFFIVTCRYSHILYTVHCIRFVRCIWTYHKTLGYQCTPITRLPGSISSQATLSHRDRCRSRFGRQLWWCGGSTEGGAAVAFAGVERMRTLEPNDDGGTPASRGDRGMTRAREMV